MKICPKCKSEEVHYRKSRQDWSCDACEHVWREEKRPAEPAFRPQKIFLSYGRDAYAEDAKQIKADLEKCGHKVWFDADKLQEGRDYERDIEEGLKWCEKVVLLMTPHSVRRRKREDPSSTDGFCLNEIASAMQRNKVIVPVLLVTLEDGPPVSINRIQFLDLRDVVHIAEHTEPYQPRFQRLIRAIENDELDFEGGQSKLIHFLQPIEFEADIAPHIARFTGREWLIAELDRWLRDKPRSRVFWLLGGPGVGKTAFAAYLCHKRGEVVAKHFCLHGHQDKADARRAVLSIVYQLSQQIPAYGYRLQNLDLKAAIVKNTQTLFDELLAQPLAAKDFPSPDGPRVVVIDGLDEASHHEHNEIAELIRDQWPKTPEWLRLVITSRPEPEVTLALQGYEPYVFQAGDDQNTTDLKTFLKGELRKRALPCTEEIVSDIVARSEGVFLYLTMLLREIDEGRLSFDRRDVFPLGLAGFYAAFFERRFPDRDVYRCEMSPLIEVLCAQREPLTPEQLTHVTGFSRFQISSRLAQLGSLFPTRGAFGCQNSQGAVEAFHKSVTDWLTSQEPRTGYFKAGPYAVDITSGHKLLAEFCWQAYEGGVPRLDYCVGNLLVHLCQSEQWDRLAHALKDESFFNEKSRRSPHGRAIREWMTGTTALLKAQPSCVVDAANFLRPVLPQLILRLEENFGPTGALKEECEPLVSVLAIIPDQVQMDLFDEIGKNMEPFPRGEKDSRTRTLTCLVQIYMEVGRFSRAYEFAQLAIKQYPESMQLQHFAAVCARFQSECEEYPAKEQQWLETAIRIEKNAQRLVNAVTHSVYPLSLSVEAQCKGYSARLLNRQGKSSEGKTLANEAMQVMSKRLAMGANPLALAFCSEILREQGEEDRAWQLATAATDGDWFVRHAQTVVTDLGSPDPLSPRYLPPFESHVREWSILSCPWYTMRQEKGAINRYCRFLIDRGILPEAVSRQPEEARQLMPKIEERCSAARRDDARVALRIQKWVIDTDVRVWSFAEGGKEWTVIGIPELNLYGCGATFVEATEYLRSFTQQVYVCIAHGQYRHLRGSDHLAICRWVENRMSEPKPEEDLTSHLQKVMDAYAAGHLEEATRLGDEVVQRRAFLTSEQLAEFMRTRSRVQARRGFLDGLQHIMGYVMYNRVSLLTVTDFLAVYRFQGLAPADEMDAWAKRGQVLAQGAGPEQAGAMALFLEYWGNRQASRGHDEEAVKLLEKALEIEEAGMKELRILARIRSALADVYRRRGSVAKARGILESTASSLAEAGLDGDLAEFTLPNLAKAQQAKEDALRILRQGFALAERLNCKKAMLRSLLLEARICANAERRKAIFDAVVALANEMPAVLLCPLFRRIKEQWNQWCSSPELHEDDYWGL